MKLFARIQSTTGSPMSKFHAATPKVLNGMKEQADRLSKMFGEEFKIVRYMKTPKGMKRV